MRAGDSKGWKSMCTLYVVYSSLHTDERAIWLQHTAAFPVAAWWLPLCSSVAIETSRYRLDGASKPAITCSLPQSFQGPSHHLSPFTLLLIAHLITIDLTVITGLCCGVAEERIRNIYPFSQHKCVKVCSRFYEARSKTAAFTESRGVNCWGIMRWLLPAHYVSLDRSTHRLLCWAQTGGRKETISWRKVGQR